MTFDDRSACHMGTSPSIPTVFTLLHFPTHSYTFPSGRKVLEVLESLGLKTIFLYTFALSRVYCTRDPQNALESLESLGFRDPEECDERAP